MNFKQKLGLSYTQKLDHIKTLLDNSQQFDGATYSAIKSGIEIDVFKNVFSPSYFDDSEYFANNIQSVSGLDVLEIGTGTGLIAIKLAMGNALKVVATDVNPAAVINARHNVVKHNLQSKVDIRLGYIFQPVKGEKFDLIFWNIPFGYVDADLKSEIGLCHRISELEKSVFNPYYNFLHDYLNEGFDYLKPNGMLQLGFSPTIGREDILDDIIEDLDLEKHIIKENEVEMDGSMEILQILEIKRKNQS
jgi:release factor glutamine methyltransferase